MSNKYYQKHKEKPWKEALERYQNLSEKKKKKKKNNKKKKKKTKKKTVSIINMDVPEFITRNTP